MSALSKTWMGLCGLTATAALVFGPGGHESVAATKSQRPQADGLAEKECPLDEPNCYVNPNTVRMNCNFEGQWTCPDDGATFGYAPLGCSNCGNYPTSIASAQHACDVHCTATCTNTGYVIPC